jgi:beta-lactam-binding protein with PASTA domain
VPRSRVKRFTAFLFENALLAGALVLTAALSAVTTMRIVLASQEVVVPSLLERRVADAGALAGRSKLLLRVEGKRHDDKVAVDAIVAQEPAAGARLKAQRSVRVWVSLGPRRLNVPALEGQSLRTARLTLDQLQLPVARVAEVPDDAEAGTILVQNPPPGETEHVGAGVTLLVSRGPRQLDYVMPDLIGRRVEDVERQLARAGLRTGEVRVRSYPGVAPGIVLRHVPPAGHRVNTATPITLDVSSNPSS